jgi:hypothetical protein
MLVWGKATARECDSMRKFNNHITVMYLAFLGVSGFAGCAEDDSKPDTPPEQMTAASKAKTKDDKGAAAGSGAGAMVAPGDQIGASAVAPPGDCAEGFACTRVLFPENERVCMKPGDTLAPSCDDKGQCPGLPNADCIDTGTTGKLCTQFCKV